MNTPAPSPLVSLHPVMQQALAPFVAPIGYHYNGLNYATQADADEAARRDQAACAMQRKQNQLMALEGWPS